MKNIGNVSNWNSPSQHVTSVGFHCLSPEPPICSDPVPKATLLCSFFSRRCGIRTSTWQGNSSSYGPSSRESSLTAVCWMIWSRTRIDLPICLSCGPFRAGTGDLHWVEKVTQWLFENSRGLPTQLLQELQIRDLGLFKQGTSCQSSV